MIPATPIRIPKAKPKPEPAFSWDDIDKINQDMIARWDKPEGAVTATEYAEHYNCGVSTARVRLAGLVKQRKMEKIQTVVRGDRGGTLVNYYRPIKG